MRVRELLKLLQQNGWKVKNQEGFHIHLINKNTAMKITVPNHAGDLKIGTLNGILKDAGLK